MWTPDGLIYNSPAIIVATAENPVAEIQVFGEYEYKSTKLTLRIDEYLKGDWNEVVKHDGRASLDTSTDSLTVYTASPDDHYSDHFNGHTDVEFCSKDIGRMTTQGGCIVQPTFVDGETYLLFLDSPGAAKSAEIVGSPDDRWLVYVRQKVVDQEKLKQTASLVVAILVIGYLVGGLILLRSVIAEA